MTAGRLEVLLFEFLFLELELEVEEVVLFFDVNVEFDVIRGAFDFVFFDLTFAVEVFCLEL